MTRPDPTVTALDGGAIRCGRWYVFPDGLVAVQDEPRLDAAAAVMAVRGVDDAHDLTVALVAWAERHDPSLNLPAPVQHVICQAPSSR